MTGRPPQPIFSALFLAGALASAFWLGQHLHGEHRAGWNFSLHLVVAATGGVVCLGAVVHVHLSKSKNNTGVTQDSQRHNTLAAFFQEAPALIFLKDWEGRYVHVNSAFATLLQRPESDIHGKTDFDLRSLPIAQNLDKVESEIRRTRNPRRVVEEFELQNGTTSHWRILRFRIDLPEGGSLLAGIGLDVTRSIRSEAEILKIRDAALESAQLKSAFLANMSHEIRTPMNGILGMTGLLMDTDLSGRQRDFVKTISSSAHALLHILNDTLDLSKIEAGMFVLEEQDFDLEEVLYGTIELLAERAAQKKLDLAVICNPSVPSQLRGDPGRLRQILLNLLSNAIKFTEHGEVVLACSLETDAEPRTSSQTKLRFEVSDTGIGISEADQPALFSAFTQADNSTTRRHGGTGLGLAISKQLAHAMRGEIGLHSVLNGGSTFWFTATFSAPRTPELANRADFHSSLKSRIHNSRVLIADPHAASREGIAQWLSAMGASVFQSPTLDGAEEWIQSFEPLDIPKIYILASDSLLNGPEADRFFTNNLSPSKNLAILAPFSRVALTPREQFLGFSELLHKPVRISHLLRWMTGTLPSVHRRDASPSFHHPLKQALRVLIAEDHPVNQQILTHQLNKVGCSIVGVAETGKKALDLMETTMVDAVLLDCQMPELDGYDTARAIRARERQKRIRPAWIIALTAHAMAGDRERCLQAGMDDYLSKPVSETVLFEALEKALTHLKMSSIYEAAPPLLQPDVPPVLDPKILQKLREWEGPDSSAIFDDLCEKFVQTGTVLVNRIIDACERNDWKSVLDASHTLKGSAGHFGGLQLVSLCEGVELANCDSTSDEIRQAAARIPLSFQKLCSALADCRVNPSSK